MGTTMQWRRGKRTLFMVLYGCGAILVPLLLCEGTLRLLDARRPQNDAQWTWGYRIRKNALGFREQEVTLPKPAGLFRIMVLGDSLTWGVGLAPEERYTDVLGMRLRVFYQKRRAEVLNFALTGASTIQERDLLATFAPSVTPDLVVIGFCVDDPQPRAQDYAVEREQYRWLLTGAFSPHYLGLWHAAAFLRERVDHGLQNAGLVPTWPAALSRTYDPSSPEWLAFTGALADIVRLTQARGLPAPVFVPLLSFSGDYGHPDALLHKMLAWSHQATEAAQAAGFVTVSMEEAFRAEGARERAVNAWDNHPDAESHSVYARRLAEALAPMVPEGKRQGTGSSSPEDGDRRPEDGDRRR